MTYYILYDVPPKCGQYTLKLYHDILHFICFYGNNIKDNMTIVQFNSISGHKSRQHAVFTAK